MTRIAVLGSTNMDLVAYTARAPGRGETVTGREFRTVPGGKGANQAVAAARAGGEVAMIGAVGDDAYGTLLRDGLEHAGVDTDLLHTAEGPSGTAHIVVDDTGANAIVVIPGANGVVTALGPGEIAAIAAADLLLMQLELPCPRSSRGPARPGARAYGPSSPPPPLSPCPMNSSTTSTCWCPTSTRQPSCPGRPNRTPPPRSCCAGCPRSSSRSARRAACTRPGAVSRCSSRPPR